MRPEDIQMPKDKFVFVQEGKNIHDKELVTKPIGYFRDAWNRFKKNKASIVAAIIIGIMLLFSIFGPLFTPYHVADEDNYMRYNLPKSRLFSAMGADFWDGCESKESSQTEFYYFYSMGVETGHNAIKNQEYKVEDKTVNGRTQKVYSYRFDTYQKTGVIFKDFTKAEYLAIQDYQNKTGIQVIYPMTKRSKRPQSPADEGDANYWFKTDYVNGRTQIVLTNGEFTNIYLPADEAVDDYNSLLVEGKNKEYAYAYQTQTGYNVRINYYEYYIYYHTEVAKDGISTPYFLFGSTNTGKDIFVCLASGARFSFILAISVALVNLLVGAIYGAIEGYYGGRIDMIMERIVEILSAVPFMIVITLLKFHMQSSSQVLILFIAFFLTGWIGMAGRTRMQFYRFKNQEYVLAARSLGAKDARIMFKHIFPNALGTLITGSVLVIPGMIFSETSLSYLGIINLNSGSMTSVGTLLANAQAYLTSYPHMMIPPAVFISLLMLSFNLFGNGLRDAFNPSLRGSED